MQKRSPGVVHVGAGLILLLVLTVLFGGLIKSQSRPPASLTTGSPDLTSTTEAQPSSTFVILSTPTFTPEFTLAPSLTPSPILSPSPAPVSNSFSIFALTFINSLQGWASVRTCDQCEVTIYATRDGGQTWDPFNAPGEQGEQIRSVRFLNAQEGLAFGQNLYSTHDGGVQWTRVDFPSQGTLLTLGSAGETLWAIQCLTLDSPCPSTLLIYEGQTWQPAAGQPPLPPLGPGGNSPYPWIQLVPVNDHDAWIHTFSPDPPPDHENSQLITTHDGGRTWQTLADPCPTQGRLTAFDALHLWRQCELGSGSQFINPMAVYRSVDGGVNWELVAQTDDSDPTSLNNGLVCNLTFISPEHGFMTLCNAYGSLMTTSDGGYRWKKVELGAESKRQDDCITALYVSGLVFSDVQHGWVIEDITNSCQSNTTSLLYRTLDSGVTWEQVALTFH